MSTEPLPSVVGTQPPDDDSQDSPLQHDDLQAADEAPEVTEVGRNRVSSVLELEVGSGCPPGQRQDDACDEMSHLPTNGLMPDGSRHRRDAKLALTARVEAANDRLRDTWSRSDIEDVHVAGLVARMRSGHRWAHQAYQKYRLAAGDAAPLAEKIAKLLGASLDVARGAIEVHRQASGAAADPRVLLEQAESYLRERYAADPALAYRSPLRRLLLDVDAGSVNVLQGADMRSAGLADADPDAQERRNGARGALHPGGERS